MVYWGCGEGRKVPFLYEYVSDLYIKTIGWNSLFLVMVAGLYYSLQKGPLPPEVETSLAADNIFFSIQGRENSPYSR